MQSIFRRSSHDMPGLNLASMPDLIFTVLFFFMIVTHMRHDDVRVRYQVPAGTEVQKLQQKSAVINVYIGPSAESGQSGLSDTSGMSWRIQMNGQLTDIDHLSQLIEAERKKLSEDNAERLTVSLKADKHTPMGVIADVKEALQRSFALRINYSGTEMRE
ncbi:MAG: biopolymer transporter ExbD [Prevotella sp.]|nr:biopolymer transporter ExbD [Prevotella sp.]